MNTIKKLLLAFCLLSVPFFSSCGKDNDDPDPCNYTTELQAEVNAWSTAFNNYIQDQSQANCLEYKAALLAYIDAAGDLNNCVPASQQVEYQASLDDAEAEANALLCQ